MSSLIRAPLPPRLVLQAANTLQATEIHTSGCNAATVWWLSPEDGGTRLTVAHFNDRGPTYDDALSQLSDVPGPLLLMLPTDLAPALRRELDRCDGLKVGWRLSQTAPCWPSSTGKPRTAAGGTQLCPTPPGATRT